MRTQYGETQAEGRYVYDPTGRRVGKRVWKREPVHWSETRTELSARPYETWYGWEGDRLTTVQTQQRRVQTVYAPGSFTPLLRVETENTELAKTRHRSLAEKLEQEGSGDGEAVQFPAALRAMLDRLEDELRRDAVSEESRAWLTQCGLTAEQMKNQLEPHPEPERKLHLYHCDHRGLPLALISPDNTVAWRAEYDEWGNQLSEDNPAQLEQLIRLPGQQYDGESGLYYNRHRYYNPGQGRYITQDPAGLKGGLNPYTYPLDPVVNTDPKGLCIEDACILEGAAAYSLWQWLVVGSAGAAIVANDYDNYNEARALNEKLQRSKTNTESLTNCPTIPPEDPCDKKLDDGLLRRMDIPNPHQVKKDWMGDTAKVSRFDLCGCKDGRVVIKDKFIDGKSVKDCKGKIVSPTEYNWK